MKRVILGHSRPDVDSILSGIILEIILNKIKTDNIEYKFIIPDKIIDSDTKSIVEQFGIDLSRFQKVSTDKDDELILVDHNEEDRFDNPIIAIYDHHPDSKEKENKSTKKVYIVRNSCSTTTILAQEYFNFMTIDMFLWALIGALVDTASFNSTKTNKLEEKWLREKSKGLGINIDDYYDIGLCLTDITNIKEAYLNGLKSYVEGSYKIESSYIQIKDIEKNNKKIDDIIDLIKQYIIDKQLNIFVFIVHDMDKMKTIAYIITKNSIEKKEYQEYTSRGNTIIPYIREKCKEGKK